MPTTTICVVLLTEEQNDSLLGKQLQLDWYFSTIYLEDITSWAVTADQQQNCTNPEFAWLKELPVIEYQLTTNPPVSGSL